ncbi:MAG: DASS family sodium-coupled anion symporter [Saprospiraceae bacterium]|nr:DASS family sodium-coupled anion symporter [Saprospiraceae bacterium]
MADSRRASSRKLKTFERRVEIQTRIIQFLSSILLGLLFTHLLSNDQFATAQNYVLFLIFFSIGLWVTEAIPPFAVGIMIVGFLVFFLGQPEIAQESGIKVEEFVNTWSNSVIWLLLGGFFLAEGMRKTGLDFDIFKTVMSRFSNNPRILLLALMLGTAIASMVMSNTATTAMMLAAIAPVIHQIGQDSKFSKSVLLGIPAAASIGGMGTIIGSPPNAIAVDTINRIEGLPFQVGFFEWMIFGTPVAILLTIFFWFILNRKYPPENVKINLQELEEQHQTDDDHRIKEERKTRKSIVLGVMMVTVLLWLTDGFHPIPMAAVSGIPIIIFTMVSIISSDDVRQLPWDTLMLVAGGLSLGLAIQETGLADYFIDQLKNVNFSGVIMLVIFAVVTVVASNIMSNTAAAAILIPAAGLWGGLNPALFPTVIGLCASCALFLPVSTPPNAIAYSTGMVGQSEFRLGGVVIGISGPILIILWMSGMMMVMS